MTAASPSRPPPSSPTSTTTGRCCWPPWPSRGIAGRAGRVDRPGASTGRRTTWSWCARPGTTHRGATSSSSGRDRVAAVTRLANPADVLALEHRQDLPARALRGAGLPVVATDWLVPGRHVRGAECGGVRREAGRLGGLEGHQPLPGRRARRAGRRRTPTAIARGRPDRHGAALPRTRSTPPARPRMLFFGGEFSHAIRKGPLLDAGDGARSRRLTSRGDRSRASRRRPSATRPSGCSTRWPTLAPVGRGDLLYARVDLVPGPDGEPTLLELELTEPSMFLIDDGTGGARLGASASPQRRGRRCSMSDAAAGPRDRDVVRRDRRRDRPRAHPARRRGRVQRRGARAVRRRACPRSPAARTSRRWCRPSSGPAPTRASGSATSTRSPSPAGPG